MDIDEEIKNVWDEMGLSDQERQNEKRSLNEEIDKVKRDFIQETVQKCQTLSVEIEETKAQHIHMLEITGSSIGEIDDVQKNGLRGTLKERFDQVIGAFEDYKPRYNEIIETFQKYVRVLEEMFDTLEIPEEEREGFQEVGDSDLTKERMKKFQNKIDQLSIEINANNQYADPICKQIIDLSEQLGLEVNPDITTIIESRPIRPSQLFKLKEEKKLLQSEVEENTDRIAQLALEIQRLWDILKVPEAERNEFKDSQNGISFRQINACIDLINTLNANRNKQVPVLIKTVKQEIKDLCDTMQYTQEQKDEVFHHAIDRMNSIASADVGRSLLQTPMKPKANNPKEQPEIENENELKPDPPTAEAKADDEEIKTTNSQITDSTQESTNNENPENDENMKPDKEEEKQITEDEKQTKVEENSGIEEERPSIEEGKSVQQEEKPVIEEEKLVIEDGKPVHQEEKPLNEEEEPVNEEEKPVNEEEKLATEQEKSVNEEEKLVHEDEKTIKEEGKTAKEEEKPTQLEEVTPQEKGEIQSKEEIQQTPTKKLATVVFAQNENGKEKFIRQFVDSDEIEMESIELLTQPNEQQNNSENKAEIIPNTNTEEAAIVLFEALDGELMHLKKLYQQSLPIIELIKQRETLIEEHQQLTSNPPKSMLPTEIMIFPKSSSVSNTDMKSSTINSSNTTAPELTQTVKGVSKKNRPEFSTKTTGAPHKGSMRVSTAPHQDANKTFGKTRKSSMPGKSFNHAPTLETVAANCAKGTHKSDANELRRKSYVFPHSEGPAITRLLPPNPSDSLHAEKINRRFKTVLPRIEKKLALALYEFQKENGEEFTLNGKIYSQELAHIKLTPTDKKMARSSLSTKPIHQSSRN